MSYLQTIQTPRAPGGWPGVSSAAPRRLLLTGWAVTLLYFPSGLMHALLGRGVYVRDVLLILHFGGCLFWLWKQGELANFARRQWPLMIPAVFILPALAADVRVEALTFIKWGMFWLDWLILGRLAGFVRGWTTPVKILATVTVLLLLADLGAGTYERSTGTFVISGMADERTAFGVEMDREHHLFDQLRVKGLQRDVFSFSNLMGMCAVAGVLGFVNASRPVLRLLTLVAVGCFTAMVVTSGGRSSMFGVLAGVLAGISLTIAPQWVRRHYPAIVLGWLLVCLTISVVGVGRLAESVGGSMFQGAGVGNSQSAYMRDDNWAGIFEAIKTVPVVLVFGAPLASLMDPKVDAIFHWADNEYLWLIYHASVLGFAAVVWYFRSAVAAPVNEERAWVRDALILFLLYVMGEAIARESLTFLGCLPLFLAIGYEEAGRAGSRPESRTRPPRESERRSRREAAEVSEASDFSRRIRAKAKERG